MTKKQLEAERDRLFSLAIEGPCLLDKRLMWDTAFTTTVGCMEEKRVKPLKEALDKVLEMLKGVEISAWKYKFTKE